MCADRRRQKDGSPVRVDGGRSDMNQHQGLFGCSQGSKVLCLAFLSTSQWVLGKLVLHCIRNFRLYVGFGYEKTKCVCNYRIPFDSLPSLISKLLVMTLGSLISWYWEEAVWHNSHHFVTWLRCFWPNKAEDKVLGLTWPNHEPLPARHNHLLETQKSPSISPGFRDTWNLSLSSCFSHGTASILQTWRGKWPTWAPAVSSSRSCDSWLLLVTEITLHSCLHWFWVFCCIALPLTSLPGKMFLKPLCLWKWAIGMLQTWVKSG